MNKKYIITVSTIVLLVGFFSGLVIGKNITVKTANNNVSVPTAKPTVTPSAIVSKDEIFDSYNILSFEQTEFEHQSYDNEVMSTFTVKNMTQQTSIKGYSADIAYYDEIGNLICTDSRTSYALVEPQKTAILRSYSYSYGESSKISKAAITSYVIYFTETLSNGCNAVEVNLQTNDIQFLISN